MNSHHPHEYQLDIEERRAMRRHLHAYMAAHPLPVSSPISIWRTFHVHRFAAAFTMLATLTAGTGLSYAAEGALPGDALYVVKTHVNEPVAGVLAQSSKQKIAWAASVANERIKEAASLAAEGTLTPEIQDSLQNDFKEHAQIVVNTLAEEDSDDTNEQSIRVEAQLNENQRVLSGIADSQDVSVETFSNTIQDASAHLRIARAPKTVAVAVFDMKNTEIKPSTQKSDDRTIAHIHLSARDEIKATTELMQSSEQLLTSSTAESVSLRLQAAHTSLNLGEEQLKARDLDAASESFSRAFATAAEVTTFLETSRSLHSRTGMRIRETRHSHERPLLAKGASVKKAASLRTISGPELNSDYSSTSEIQTLSLPATTTSTASTSLLVPNTSEPDTIDIDVPEPREEGENDIKFQNATEVIPQITHKLINRRQ